MSKVKRLKRAKQKKSFEFRLKKGTVYSIVELLMISIAVLLVISFSRQGKLLIIVNDWLMNYFSWTSIFLPFIFLVMGLLFSRFKTPVSQPNVVVGSILFFISIMGLTKAGVLGKGVWEGIEPLLTKTGAFFSLLTSSLVGLIVLLNIPFEVALSFVLDTLRILRDSLFGSKVGMKKGLLNKRRDIKIGGLVPSTNNMAGKVETFQNRDGAGSNLPLSFPSVITNQPGSNEPWKYPDISIFTTTQSGVADRGDVNDNAATIEKTLDNFGIYAKVVEVNYGPAVTQYAIQVAAGVKLSKIMTLERDLALALAAPTGAIRIEAPIPGKSLVGIELPNLKPEFVSARQMLESDVMTTNPSKLLVALGLDVTGKPVVADLGKMPHVLIAGQTGAGKSVCLNTFLSSLLFRASPSEVKLVLVDPKRVEMIHYTGIPHLLTPVITDYNEVINVLHWVVNEMEMRYKKFSEVGVRNIDTYNEMSGFQSMPYIVVVVDELAEIMFSSPVEVEEKITRIAQKSRATGIHMVLATQRPSVDVITGLIKANIPCRIAFKVASQVDSRVILDLPGAEKLLGKGDMLYLPPDQAKPVRIQGAFVSDKDIASLTSYLKNLGVGPQYVEEATQAPSGEGAVSFQSGGKMDERFAEAVRLVCQYDKASTSLLQRRMSVGYSRAAKIMDQLEEARVISPPQDGSKREVLISDAEAFLSSFGKI